MGTGPVRIGLAAFVLLWLLGPDFLQKTIPIWIVFLAALALEVNFFFGARRAEAGRPTGFRRRSTATATATPSSATSCWSTVTARSSGSRTPARRARTSSG